MILTSEAVAAVLADAGFPRAEMDDANYRPVTEGFTVYRVPVTHEDRVGVSWHPDGDLAKQETDLLALVPALEAAGYQAEFVTEAVRDYYLVVWLDGDF